MSRLHPDARASRKSVTAELKPAVSAGTWPPSLMDQSSTRVPRPQPAEYVVTVVSGPGSPESRSMGSADVSARSAQPLCRRHWASVSVTEGYGRPVFAPPPKRMVWSAVPWIIDGVLVFVKNLDQHFARAKTAGATILSEIESDPPGKRYRAEDLEGHRWFFFEK